MTVPAHSIRVRDRRQHVHLDGKVTASVDVVNILYIWSFE